MLFTNNIHIYFSVDVHVCILYTYAILYAHTVDTYMTAVCINVYMITFNVHITVHACFDRYARATTLLLALGLITDRLWVDNGNLLL